MSLHVWGVEGSLSPEAVVVWGAAALLVDGNVVNSFTKRNVTLQEAERLSAEGHIFRFEELIKLRAVHEASPLIATLIRRASPWHSLFAVEREKAVGLAKTAESAEWLYYIFEDEQAFVSYAMKVANAVLGDILYSRDIATEVALARHRAVVRSALGLIPGHADLNALRVFLTPKRIVENAARSSLRGDVAVRRFERTLTAFRGSSADQYELKYERGAAIGGGMDVNIAADTLHAVNRATQLLHGSIEKDYPYLHRIPSPRFREMKAASAHMVFVANANDGEVLGDRAARYLALESLAQAVSGNVALDDSEDQHVLDATVTKIVKPTPETTLRHKPPADTGLQTVNVPYVEAQEVLRSEHMDFVGLISGLRRDRRVELQLFPKVRIEVATNDDGDGEVPYGADTITRDGSFLRRPCLMSLVREHTPGGTTRFLLRRLQLIELGRTVTATALPSSVVSGAFLVGRRLRFTLTKDNLIEGDLGSLGDAGTGKLESGQRLLDRLSAAALEYELSNANGARWVQVVKPPEPIPLDRVLVVLDACQGSALIDVIRTLVERRFGATVRSNNTRREVRRHPDLLFFDPENPRMVRWTDRGRLRHLAYVGAGGMTQSAMAEA